MLESLLRGYEAELEDGAKGDISSKILNLFSEVKRIQNEQPIDEEPSNQVVCMRLMELFERKLNLRIISISAISTESIGETIHSKVKRENGV